MDSVSKSNRLTMIIRWVPDGEDLDGFWNSILAQSVELIEIILLHLPKQQVDVPDWLLEEINRRDWSLKSLDIRAFKTSSHPLKNIMGEYVCFPELAGVLAEDYATSMITMLAASDDVDGIRCNGVYVADQDREFIIDELAHGPFDSENHLLEKMVSRRITINLSLFMFKSASVSTIRLPVLSLEKLVWNWQFIIPFTASTRIRLIEDSLLTLIHYGSTEAQDRMTHYASKLSDMNALATKALEIIANTVLKPEKSKRLALLVNLSNMLDQYYLDLRFRLVAKFPGHWDALKSYYLEDNFPQLPSSSSLVDAHGISLSRAVGIWSEYFAQLLLGHYCGKYSREMLEESIRRFSASHTKQASAPVIFYGNGAAAKELVEMFVALGIVPDRIWDNQAEENLQLYGIPVIKPDYHPEAAQRYAETTCIISVGKRQVAEIMYKSIEGLEMSQILNLSDRQGAIEYILSQAQNVLEMN